MLLLQVVNASYVEAVVVVLDGVESVVIQASFLWPEFNLRIQHVTSFVSS